MDRKNLFFAEITDKVLRADHPVILGGDFNLIRYDDEKSNGLLHRSLMFKFNCMINLLQLRELHRASGKFTWTNKQTTPTMEVLDRVLVSNSWEAFYPLSSVMTKIRLGSDHCPILVDLGNEKMLSKRPFRMEPSWFLIPQFKTKVLEVWPVIHGQNILD